MDATRQLLSDDEAADRLSMLRARLVRLAKAGDVPHVILPDGELRFIESDLWDWVEKHKHGTAAGATP